MEYKIESTIEENTEMEDVMCLYEEVDIDALRIIRDNFEIIYDRLDNSFGEFNGTEWTEVDFKTASTIINAFYNAKKTGKKVVYKYGNKLKSGRRFAKNSLQSLCRPLRHTIAKSLYYDVDMKNAHPTFLKYLVEKLQFDHPILQKYISNRDELLSTWIGTTNIFKENDKVPGGFENIVLKTKDDVKKYFLAILNGGGTNKTTCSDLNEFYTTHQLFLDLFYKHPEYKNYKFRADNKYKTLKDRKDNRRGTCLNYWLCDIENIALSVMERFLIAENISYGTLCFDGIMIYRRDVKDINELLTKLEDVLLQKMPFPISLSVKEMNEDIDITDLRICPDVKLTEQDYALHLLESLKPIIKNNTYQKQLYVYNESTALWIPQKYSHLRIYITDILDPYITKHPDADERHTALQGIRTNKVQNNIISMMSPYLDMMDDTKFIIENFDCARGILPIANRKVIEFKTNTVRDRVKTDYFTKTTNNNKVPITDVDRTIVLKYFYDWLNTTDERYVECLLKVIAYIFAGETYLKAIFNFIGGRDGGKSTFLDLLTLILGDFACIANTRLFINQRNKAVHDSEMFNLLNMRLATLSETKESESYNVVLMKAISGNDKLNIRGAGEKQSIDVYIRAILAIATNCPCKFDDDAFASRLWCYNFSNRFIRDDSFVSILKSRRDLIFTVIAEYGQRFYNEGINKVPQVESFTTSIIDDQDSVKKWIRSQKIVKTESKADYLNAGVLFDRYVNDCRENNEKSKVYGKIDFYKRFEEFYKLNGIDQIKYNENG